MALLKAGGATAVFMALAMAAAPASASDDYLIQTGASCSGAIFNQAGGLVSSKTGIKNGSASGKFVICSFPVAADYAVTQQFDYFSAGFVGPDGAVVKCSVSVGDPDDDYGTKVKQMTLSSAGDRYMRFYAADMPLRATDSAYAQLYCSLPPDVELQGMWLGIVNNP